MWTHRVNWKAAAEVMVQGMGGRPCPANVKMEARLTPGADPKVISLLGPSTSSFPSLQPLPWSRPLLSHPFPLQHSSHKVVRRVFLKQKSDHDLPLLRTCYGSQCPQQKAKVLSMIFKASEHLSRVIFGNNSPASNPLPTSTVFIQTVLLSEISF